jgi:protein-L-isoaspartate(D-aspartate) O-methyltransferase
MGSEVRRGLGPGGIHPVLIAALLAAAALRPAPAGARPQPATVDRWQAERVRMVAVQIEARGVTATAVLQALRDVPRHEFVAEPERWAAYEDSALPIGHGQTLSQPYLVALMTDLLEVGAGHRVLEVGTGSGYQAAVLAELGVQVFTVEIVDALARRARKTLKRLHYADRVEVKSGDGFSGWPEHKPFDGILVTCAVPEVPPPLLEQLRPGGRLVAPIGAADGRQVLTVVTKGTDGTLTTREVLDVRFVPLTGPHGSKAP